MQGDKARTQVSRGRGSCRKWQEVLGRKVYSVCVCVCVCVCVSEREGGGDSVAGMFAVFRDQREGQYGQSTQRHGEVARRRVWRPETRLGHAGL